MRKLRFGLPVGSLNTIGRGNTSSLLGEAGYVVTGYDPRNEHGGLLAIDNDPSLEARLVKPRNVPGDLTRGLLDIAITGDDCILDWPSSKERMTKLTDLEYGGVSVVVAVPVGFDCSTFSELLLSYRESDRTLTIYTEYVTLTKNYLLANETYQQLYEQQEPVTDLKGYEIGDNNMVRIVHSQGTTEEYLQRGFAIVDNTQTGATLRAVGGRELEIVMQSSVGLFCRADLQEDSWGWSKANEVKESLASVVVARKYTDVKFNVEHDRLEQVLQFLKGEALSLKNPTVSEILGPDREVVGYAVNIVVPKAGWPRVRAMLKQDYGVSGMLRGGVSQLEI